MAGGQLDQVVVGSKFDSTGFATGLAQASAEFQQFTQRTTAVAAPVIIDLRLTGADVARREAQSVTDSISPAAFEAFSQATTQAFGQVAESLTALNATIQTIAQPIAALFQGIEQGSAQALTGLSATRAEAERLSATKPTLDASGVTAGVTASQEAVAGLTGVIEGIPATVREAAASLTGLSAVTIPPIVIPPPVFSVPDFSETIAETVRAADVMRAEFDTVVSQARLGPEWASAARASVSELEAAMLGKIGELRDLVASGLINPADFARQADLAIAAFSQEIEARKAQIPEIVLRVRGTQPAAFKDVVIPTAELEAAERAFDATSSSMNRAGEEAQKVGRHYDTATRASNTLRNSLVVLSSQAVGTSSTLGQLAQSALLFSGGTQLVIGAAASVLALVTAYEFLNTAAREASAANEKLVQGLLSEANGASPAAEKAARSLAAAVLAQADAEKALQQTRGFQAVAGAAPFALPITPFLDERAREQEAQSRDAERAQLQAIEDQKRAVTDFQALNVKTLTESISLHQADAGQIANAQAFVTILAQEEQNANLPIAARLELHRQLVTLQAALNQGVQEEVALRAFQASQEQTRITALAQAPGLGTDTAASIRERATEMARLNAIIHSGTASLTERNAAAQQFNALVAGAQVPLDRQRAEALQVAQAQASAYHDVAQAFADALAVVQAAISTLDQGDEFTQIIGKQQAAARQVLGNIAVPKNDVGSAFDQAAGSVDNLQKELEQAITASDRFGAHAVRNANDARSAQQRLNDGIHEVTRGLDQIVSASVNVGLIGTEAANAIGSVLSLGDAIGSVIEKASAGNILGLIGAGVGLIGAVAAPHESELERNAVLAQNNQRLQELTAALDRGIGTIGGLAAQRATLEQLLANRAILTAAQRTGTPIDQASHGGKLDALQGDPRQALNDAFAAAGTNAREFAAALKAATGIDILDKKGRIVAAAFDEAREAIDKMVEAATHFSTSISAQQQQIETRDLLGLPSPDTGQPNSSDSNVARLQRDREIELNNLHLSDQEEARIRALDLSTAQGRAEFLKFEQDLFKRAAAGSLSPDQLGGFQSVDELLGIINDAAGGLSGFADATKNATDQMRDFNLPQGFKRAALAFQNADFGPDTGPPPVLHPTEFHPGLRGTDGSSLPPIENIPGSTMAPSFTIAQGAIVVNAAPGQSPEAVAAAVVVELRRTALAQSGDTLQVPIF